ncbi:hypothetical protein ACQP1P_21625 [Dactylosporangium sp. CA-052675]|uniref:hypothetical protein n=1 Tax=Dactylosporangium sp. CA-052675 TaxID=3239927 RepID=UPI003D8F40E9
MHATNRAVPRRLLLAGGLGVLAGAGLGGCVVDEHHPSVAGGDGTPGPPFPNSVDHRYGTTTITARPERVAALGRGDADLAGAFAIGTALSIPYALDRFVPMARKALGG